MEWKMALWFVGMWIVGGLAYTFFGMQITITNKCAMKLYAMLKNDTTFWYPDACFLYFKKINRRNRIIIAALFIAVYCFIPLIGLIGFTVGFFLRRLTTSGATGITKTNLTESVEIFFEFVKPEMENEFMRAVLKATDALLTNGIYKSI